MSNGDGPVETFGPLRNQYPRRGKPERTLPVEHKEPVASQPSWEALEEYSELFNASPVPCVTLDQSGLVRKANQAATELLGADIVGMSLRCRLDPADRRRFLDFLTELRRDQNATCSCEVVISRKGRPVGPMGLAARRVKAAGGPLLVTFSDLTARDEALAEQKRLQQNEIEAKAATEARDQFMAMLSHELRTPLTPVMAAVSALLRPGHAPARLKKTLELISRNIEAERRLIDDLLDTSRIQHGKMRVERAPTDVHALVEEALDLVRSEIGRRHISVVTDLSAERPWAFVDGGRIRQVFWNLLQNAVKFSANGSKIAIHSWNRAGNVAVEITDDGVGMSPETVKHLFMPFQQERSGAGGDIPSRAGLGLGLAISRGIVELHHGQIHAASPGPGRGARFIIELATVAPPHGSVAPSPAPAVAPCPARSMGSPARILLVEDDPDTGEILAELLRSEGFQISLATSVASALRQGVAEVDLVLSDLGLADGSGLDLMRELRTRKDVPGIALSGYGSESDILASQQAGFSTHLVKPVSLDKLVAAIRRTGGQGRPVAPC